jgi:O-acetyl-ADP-ribose deacetylase (regulator of RNase III)
MGKEIKYIKGDATAPGASGNKIIVHVCNDIGGWGRGFVMALSAKWKEPEMEYRKWYKSGDNFKLGEVQFVQVGIDTWIANMIGQRDVKADAEGNPPVRYEAIREALSKVAKFAKEKKASVHMPRIGCGLAGGTWDKMEPVIYESLVHLGIQVNVYDL